ncbi:MAG: rRNA pseudouridine synthase [Myxococcales bacterium]|nr:MAG: rRNA pseudouridine synthase [Myxococcales bacterium]
MAEKLERLQKILAKAGVASRRAAEELIIKGRVRVDGRIVTELGSKANPRRAKIEVDGKRIVLEPLVYFVFHKPRAVLSTLSDPEGRECLADYIRDVPERVYPVGRLDYHTSGVLLLTNDGELSEALMHPRVAAPKVYIAKVSGKVSVDDLQKLTQGIVLDDGYKTAPAKVHVDREEPRSTWLRIALQEGKNRQIHRMLEALDKRVMRLARLSHAGIDAEGLRPGQKRPLKKTEIEKLKKRYLTDKKSDVTR